MTFSGTTASCPMTQRSTSLTAAPTTRTTPAPRPTQRARVTLFFDGTLNNRENSAHRATAPRSVRASDGNDSYANDQSNVARLETGMSLCGAPYDRHFKMYVEGIGTTSGAADSTSGAALGMGGTGVPAKVQRGLNWAMRSLRTLPTSKIVEYVHLDAFGFSRGAAAARNFFHRSLNDSGDPVHGVPSSRVIDGLVDSGFTVNEVSGRFAGLFDTVASYGVAHFNDTSDLSLDAISAVRQTIQIAAGDEHRDNFRLTNINSASGADSFEVYLPGVHSDIGGGYNAGVPENLILWEEEVGDVRAMWHDSIAPRNRERAWFTSRGWYTAAQLTDVDQPTYSTTVDRAGQVHRNRSGTIYRLMGIRPVPFNQYTYIPMKMMADYAREQDLSFSNLASFSGDSFLVQVNSVLRAYAQEKRALRRAHPSSHPSSRNHWINVTNPMLARLRNQYLHMSAHWAPAAGGLIHPNAPNYSGEARARVVQNG